MPKLTSLLVFMAIAGCASTNPNRPSPLQINATSVSTFEASVAAFQRTLKPDRELRFVVALQEIWGATALKAGPESSEDETTKLYFAQLDGLGYDQVIGLGGPAAEKTYVALVAEQRRERFARGGAGNSNPGFADQSFQSPGGSSGPSQYLGQFPAWIAY